MDRIEKVGFNDRTESQARQDRINLKLNELVTAVNGLLEREKEREKDLAVVWEGGKFVTKEIGHARTSSGEPRYTVAELRSAHNDNVQFGGPEFDRTEHFREVSLFLDRLASQGHREVE